MDVIITSDRTLISNHHGKEFVGFMTTSPPIAMPEWLWMKICAPKPKIVKHEPLGHHDFFALSLQAANGGCLWIKSVNARSFRRFMESKEMREARKNGIKTIVMPGSMAWLYKPEFIEKWKIDTIIEGEAEKGCS